MIGSNDLQAAIISKLKADTPVTNYLASLSSANEIREFSYQSSVFAYPNLRIGVGTVNPESPLSTCYLTNGEATFTISSFSEQDSSYECDQLMKLANQALIGKRLVASSFQSLVIQIDGLVHAIRVSMMANNAPRNVWRAQGFYRVYVYET